MRKSICLLFMAMVTTVALTTPATPKENKFSWPCEEGDVRRGPNCIHTEMAVLHGLNHPVSTVYRFRRQLGKKFIVWADQGSVEVSRRKYIVVNQLVWQENKPSTFKLVRYRWDEKLKCYARGKGRQRGCWTK